MMRGGWQFPFLSIFLWPLSAVADTPVTTLWLGVSETAFDYAEYDDVDERLDRETGWLPGIQTGLGLAFDQRFVEGSLWWSAGQVDYTSPRQDTTTDEEITNLEILAGTWFHSTPGRAVGLTIGGGYRLWHRDIHDTASASGLDEIYRWGYGLLGLRGRQQLEPGVLLVADLQLTRTFDPKVEVGFDGSFDDLSLDLGAETGIKARLRIHWRVASATELWLAPWYEYWALGRSADQGLTWDGRVVGTVFEPRSETRNAGLSLGLLWRFGGP